MFLSEFRSCVKVEVAVLGLPSLISPVISVDVKRHERRSECVNYDDFCYPGCQAMGIETGCVCSMSTGD